MVAMVRSVIRGQHRDEPTKQQVFALYKLFKYEFTGPKRNLRTYDLSHSRLFDSLSQLHPTSDLR